MQLDAGYSPASDALAGRAILVTGAGAGIGRAVCLAFAAHGAELILLGRTVHKLESLYDEIVDRGGMQPAIYPMDLRGATPDEHEELAGRLDTEFGRLDGLLHNAAELGALCPIEHYEPGDWLTVTQVNLNAAFLMTRACLPLLRKAPAASIVFTADRVGRRGRAYWGAYAVTKCALEGLVQVLADELEDEGRVTVNSLNPGPVCSGIRRSAYPGENDRRLPAAESIVGAYILLMGPDGRKFHGQALDAAG